MFECEVCCAKVTELRRGRCWGCYSRWTEARAVGSGARCITCPERRRRVLKSVELFRGWTPMCFNCAGQCMTLDPMPNTITGLRDAISRERRARDRRIGKSDSRVYQYERRVGDRRTLGSDDMGLIDDDMIIEISVCEFDAGMEFEDMTRIHIPLLLPQQRS